jgi:integrase
MGKLNDLLIKSWVKKDERFQGRADGNGLVLRYRKGDAVPQWYFRYEFQGNDRKLSIGSYGVLSLAEARKEAIRLMAKVKLGHDVAGEKQARIVEAIAKIEEKRRDIDVATLADDYYQSEVLPNIKTHYIQKRQIDKDIRPVIGRMSIKDVKPTDIVALLQPIKERGAPTMANRVLILCKCLFGFAVRRGLLVTNPAAELLPIDAGGKQEARTRALTRPELCQLFSAMKQAKGFSVQNDLTIRLLLILACRKMELAGAKWAEFDLDEAVWHLPEENSKTEVAIDVPLPPVAVEYLRELKRLSGASPFVLPARRMGARNCPHISESTLNTALGKVKRCMPDVPDFIVHDLRRTARTQLSALGIAPHIAERCLNHKLGGVAGVYDTHDFFEERREAHNKLAALMHDLEFGKGNVIDLKNKKPAKTKAA